MLQTKSENNFQIQNLILSPPKGEVKLNLRSNIEFKKYVKKLKTLQLTSCHKFLNNDNDRH